MASLATMESKLIKKLKEIPDSEKHNQAPGMGMTWWEIATHVMKDGNARSRVARTLNRPGKSKMRKVLNRAVEVGIIRLRHEEVNIHDR